MRRARSSVVAVAIAIAACKRDPAPIEAKPAPSSSAAHADEPEHERLPRRVHLEADVIKAAGITSLPVAREPLAPSVELVGEIAADPDRSAEVSARMNGRLDRVAVKEGAVVKAGDLLAVVRAPQLGELASTAESLSARAKSARANAQRLEALLKSGLASQQEVVAARAEADALEAEAAAAASRLGAVGGGTAAGASLALRAPIAGTVVARRAVVGQPVTPEQSIATIVDLSEAWFLARVFEQNLARVRLGAQAEVRLNAYPGESFLGTIEYVAPQIDPAARTVVARVRLKNRGALLRLGLFGVARVATAETPARPPTLVVPRSAVVEIDRKQVVFVRHPDDDFELHEVVLGDAAPGRIEIVSGLREGELVVVSGVFTLKSAVLKDSLAEDD